MTAARFRFITVSIPLLALCSLIAYQSSPAQSGHLADPFSAADTVAGSMAMPRDQRDEPTAATSAAGDAIGSAETPPPLSNVVPEVDSNAASPLAVHEKARS